MQEKQDSTIVRDSLKPTFSEHKFKSQNLGRSKFKAQFEIHTINTVLQLLQEMQAKNEEPVLRYLVDLTNTALFAREKGGVISPPHALMTGDIKGGRCYTAGNLVLNAEFDTLVKVNHQSGDFRPSFESLQRFLALLVLNEETLPFSLPEALIVEELDSSGGSLFEHLFSLLELKAWVNTITDKDLAALKDQTNLSRMVPELSELDKSRYRASRAIPMFGMDDVIPATQANTANPGNEAAAASSPPSKGSFRQTGSPTAAAASPFSIDSFRQTGSPTAATSSPFSRDSFRQIGSPTATASSPFSMGSFRLTGSPTAATCSPFSMGSFRLTGSPVAATSSPFSRGSFQLTDSPAAATSSPSSMASFQLTGSPAAATSSPSSMASFQLTDSPAAASSLSSTGFARLAAAATSIPSSIGFFRRTDTPPTSKMTGSVSPSSSESTPKKRGVNHALFSDTGSSSDEIISPKKPAPSEDTPPSSFRRKLF
ncbi:MAG: hypothetical protein P4L65_09705 [Legionella sp.]|nr:hypothetical protein [Legionella sp.]